MEKENKTLGTESYENVDILYINNNNNNNNNNNYYYYYYFSNLNLVILPHNLRLFKNTPLRFNLLWKLPQFQFPIEISMFLGSCLRGIGSFLGCISLI